MSESPFKSDRGILFLLRLAMAWTFLWAGMRQVFDPSWSVVGFLAHTHTFHGLFVLFTGPVMAPITTFMVEWGHTLIGLSLLFGIFTSASAFFGLLLMIIYWMAHMNFPYIGTGTTSFLVDEHIVYALVLWGIIVRQAGHIWGFDGWIANQEWVKNNGLLHWAAGA